MSSNNVVHITRVLTITEQNKVHVGHRLSRMNKATDHLHEWLNDEGQPGHRVQGPEEQDGNDGEEARHGETPPDRFEQTNIR